MATVCLGFGVRECVNVKWIVHLTGIAGGLLLGCSTAPAGMDEPGRAPPGENDGGPRAAFVAQETSPRQDGGDARPADGLKNGDETDVDCGGARAPRCAPGLLCRGPADCNNGICTASRCAQVHFFDINHVLSTGQSNSVANSGSPVLTSTQPYSNTMFDVGVMTCADCSGDGCMATETPSAFVPLVEGDRFFNYGVETMSSGFANNATMLAQTRYLLGNTIASSHKLLVSLHGRSGNVYACIRKGGCPGWFNRTYVLPFSEGLMQVSWAKALAEVRGESYAVRGVTLIHGESDHYGYAALYPWPGSDGTPGKLQSYADALLELQDDYETSVKAITGQSVPVPLYLSQTHTLAARSFIVLEQYHAHKRAPGKVILIGPTYHLSFATDGIHYNSAGNRRLGAYFAKAYAKTTLGGQAWEPLRPLQVTRVANVVTVKFLVPVPPLVLDTIRVSDPGNYGFEFVDDSGAEITNVSLAGPDTVVITLSQTPTGSNRKLTYATRSGTFPGPTSGVRGNLRDSDSSISLAGEGLENFCVSFDEAVP
jgi:hypothetical protein